MAARKQAHYSSFQNSNPFIPGAPAKGEDFFGREEIINDVILFLKKKFDINLVIYGQRRVGKTSLLTKIQTDAAVLELACPVYYNLQAEYGKPLKQLLYDMANKIDIQLRLGLKVKEKYFTGSDASAYRYFREVFIPLVIEKLPTGRMLLLLFDETDVMVHTVKDKDNSTMNTVSSGAFIPFFAELSGQVQQDKHPVKFIFAVGLEYKEPGQEQFEQIAKFGSQVEIPYFKKEETERLIKKLSDPHIHFEENAIDGIYALTSGHPFFTQCLASVSYEAARKNKEKKVTPDIVEQQLMTALGRYSDGVYRVWDSFSANDQVTLYLMASIKQEDRPVNMKTLRRKANVLHISIALENFSQSLNRLKASKMIRDIDDKKGEYEFNIEFVRRWIVERITESDIIRKKDDFSMMAFKKGVFFLADVVDYTSQSNRLGDQKTAAFNEHFDKKIRELTKAHQGVFIKRIGDTVLIFFEDEKLFLEFVIQLRELSRTRCLDIYDFFADLRMVAHYGNFSFKTIEEKINDLIGLEGIKVFRIEKYAGEYDVIITNFLLGILRNALDEKNISFTNLGLGPVKLKVFDEDAFLYKLNFPVKGKKSASTLLSVKIEALEAETRVIPVFGDLYPAMNMEDNFINLDIKTGDGEKWPGKGKYLPMRETEGDWEQMEGMPGIELKMKKEKEKERERPGYVDVKTLYGIQHHGIILGLPGSGKTTILKYFASREFKENRKILEEDKKRVVLFIPCRNIPGYHEWRSLRFRGEKKEEEKADAAFNVETLLFYLTYCFLFNKQEVKEDKEKKELRIAEKLLYQAYNAGRLTLLIDALDEAPGKKIKEDIIACVKELFRDLREGPRKGRANRVFLTSRYSEREMYFTGKGVDMLKPRFEVRSLDMEQLREMAGYFYGEKTELYREFDKIVWQEEIAAKVGGTPITALLVIAYYEIFRKFDTRYHMYNIIVIFILVRVWKQIKEKHFNKDMRIFFKEAKSKEVLKQERNAREIYDALSLLSYEHMDKGTIINEEDIAGIFELFAREKVEEKQAEAEAELWLKQMKEDHLLVSAGANEYVFIHNTVMEYLAARYIVEKLDDPHYLETFLRDHNLINNLVQKENNFFATEILPLAVGSGIQNGAVLMWIINDCIRKTGDKERKALLYQLALKCLAEWESFIDRQYRRTRLDLLHRKMEEEIEDNRDAVDWIYKYMARIVLSGDKRKLKEWLETFKNMPRLTRTYFFQGYLHYDKFKRGDSEIVSLREELLYRAFNSELVERWLGEHKEAEEKVLPDKEISLLTLDSSGYHPEDKNFNYYREYSGKELMGFFGSSNFKHSGPVTCVAVSPDGKYIISGSEDNTIKLWDVITGKEIRTFWGHKMRVNSIGFSPDGKYILSGSDDNTLKLWDTETGKEIRSFKGHEEGVNSVGFNPDGKSLISGSNDKTVKLWETSSGKEIRTFKGHSGYVMSVGFSPDGKHILSGSDDKTLKLWETSGGKEIRSFNGHEEGVNSVGFNPDGKHILSGSKDRTIKLWDAGSGKEIRTFKGHKNWVRSVGFSPGGKHLISGSDDNTIKYWDVESGKAIRNFKGHSHFVTSVCFAPDGKFFLSGSFDNTIKCWHTESGKQVRTFRGHSRGANSICFGPVGNLILSGSDDETIKCWDVESGKEVRTFKGHSASVESVCFAPTGKFFLSGSADNTIKLWDVETGKAIRTFKGHNDPVLSVGINPNGKVIITGSEDGTIKCWNVESGKEMRTFKGHSAPVISVCFAPEGKSFLSGSADETIKCWDMETGKEIRTFKGHSGWVNSVYFAPDGKSFLSGSSDNNLKLWETSGGKEIRTFKGHKDWVKSVGFSPDGNYIISGSYDHTIKIWDISTGECIKTLELLWIPLDIKAMPEKPGVFATANANGTVTLFDFREVLGVK